MLTFEETGLRPEILTAVVELGYEEPTEIQEQSIPVILNSQRDLIALAQTGTGKTAAFGLPLIHQVDPSSRAVQALILCPTRELGIQILGDLEQFAKYVKGLKVSAVYGGTPIQPQIRAARGSQIIVGTPGRTLDLIQRKALDFSGIKWLVLDEADEMLNMGFQKDLDAILGTTPPEKQTLLFSATMAPEIARMAGKYMDAPDEISVGQRNAGADHVQHEFYMVHARDRYAALKRITDLNPDIYGIVFCRTRRETGEVARKLSHDGYNADALYGDLTQAQRDQVMARFRKRQLQILVATDVAARGLDVNELTHVINYELPDDLEVYIHRSGRTGRAGNSGICISIIHTREIQKIWALEKMAGKPFEQQQVPSGQEVCEKQLLHFIKKVSETSVEGNQIDPYLPGIYEELAELDREELIQRFISLEFERFLSYYRNAPDLNVRPRKGRENNERSGGRAGVKFSRFHINLGNKHGMHPGRLMGIINEQVRRRKMRIGKIDIMKKFSFFEVESRFEQDILAAFQDVTIEGIPVEVQLSRPDSSRGGDYSRSGGNSRSSNRNFRKHEAPKKKKRRKKRPKKKAEEE